MCSLTLLGCTNSIDKVKFFDRQSLPRQTLSQAEIMCSHRGHVESAITAPVIQQYDAPNARTLYPEGVSVAFFGTSGDTTATLEARYAATWNDNAVMLARDSVVIINYQSRDTIHLFDLVWNRDEGRVFSNHPVRSHNGPQVTFGDSFHSDDALQHIQIDNQHGVFILEEEDEMVEKP